MWCAGTVDRLGLVSTVSLDSDSRGPHILLSHDFGRRAAVSRNDCFIFAIINVTLFPTILIYYVLPPSRGVHVPYSRSISCTKSVGESYQYDAVILLSVTYSLFH
jgi:hypothetical protein